MTELTSLTPEELERVAYTERATLLEQALYEALVMCMPWFDVQSTLEQYEGLWTGSTKKLSTILDELYEDQRALLDLKGYLRFHHPEILDDYTRG